MPIASRTSPRPTTAASLAAGLSLVLVLVLVLGAAPTQPSDAATEDPYACRQEVFAYDEDYDSVHAASIEVVPNGDLLYTFFGGSGEGADDVAVWGSRLAVGSPDWSVPEVVFDEPNEADGNSVIFNAGDGRTLLFFVTQRGDGWSEADLRFIASEDSGETWSQPRFLREDLGWMLGNRAQRLSNGDVVLPIYRETPDRAGRKVAFLVSEDDFETWQVFPPNEADWLASPSGSLQAEGVELEDGHLLAFMRTYDGYIYSTESSDYGRTWSTPEATEFANPSARVALLKASNGNLVLVNNPLDEATDYDRSRLRVWMSEDGGETWPHAFDVEHSPGSEFSYPQLTESSDEMIHLAYTHRRMSMRHVVFNQEHIRSGEDMTSDPIVDVPYYPAVSKILFEQGLTPVNGCEYSPPPP